MEQNPRVFGRYEIVRPLSQGGMGEIFLARQVGVAGFDRLVTLKSILPRFVEQPEVVESFLNEARIVGCISHPNVVSIYEVGPWDDTYFMVMEYVDGVDLDEVAESAKAEGEALSPRFVATVGRDAALGLDAAHRSVDANGNPLQVVHRDVSPHNIMVRRDGVVKIVDFGVARAANQRAKTETGLLKGKIGYFSPEQVAGDDLDGRADQFVLGLVLWELLTGQRAFPDENALKVMYRTANERLPRASASALVAPALDDIVCRMTSINPNERFASCAEVAAELRAFVATTSGDESEVVSTVQRYCGAKLERRAKEMVYQPVRLKRRPAPAASAAASVAPPEKGVLELELDLTPVPAPAPTSIRPPVSARSPTRSTEGGAFRELDLELDPGADVPLEIGRTDRFNVAALRDSLLNASAEGDVEIDEPEAALEEVTRDEITVVWCILEAQGAQERERLGAELQASAAHAGATCARVGDDDVVFVLGAARPDNQLPSRAVRLATEVLGVVSDVAGAHESALGAKLGVTTGVSPKRDASGVATPTLTDEPVDRARRLARHAASGRVMVAQQTQRMTGRRIKYEHEMVTLVDQWNAPFVASEVAGFGTTAPAASIRGRDGERADVLRVVESAARRRGAALVVVGEGGVGKSALLAEAERIAHWKGLVVARALCGRVAAAPPFDVARQLVSSLADDVAVRLGDDGLALSGERGLRAAAKLLGLPAVDSRRVRIFLGLRGEEVDAPLERRRALTRSALFSFFHAVAEQVGLCFVLDDLHAIDAASADVVGAALAQLAHSRVGFIAATRPEGSERAFARVPRVAMTPLSADVVAALADRAAFEILPPEVSAAVVEKSAGNALSAALLVRLLIAGGVLERQQSGWSVRGDVRRLALPSSARELVRALAGRLSSSARAYLRLAGHFGHEVPSGIFNDELGGDELAATAVIEASGVDFVETSATGSAVLFRSTTLREAAAGLPVERGAPSTSPSAVIAGALERTALADATLRWELIAHHAADGGVMHLVAPSNAAVATYHAACGHLDLAAEGFRRALILEYRAFGRGAPDEETAKRVLTLLEATFENNALVDPQGAVELVVPLLKNLPHGVARVGRARVQRERGLLLLRLGRLLDAERALEEALELCPPAFDMEEAAHTISAFALVLEARNDAAGAIARLTQVIDALRDRECSDETFRWATWSHLGRLYGAVGEIPAAKWALQQGYEEATRRKSARGLAEVTETLARVWLRAGDLGAVVATFDLAAEQWLSFGDRAAAAVCLQSAAVLLAQAIEIDQAHARAVRALDYARVAEWSEGIAALRKLCAFLESKR